MKTLRVILDTNVVISGLVFGGNSRNILKSLQDHRFVYITSEILLAELADVLAKKFDFSRNKTTIVIKKIEKISQVVTPDITIDILEDKADNRVLEAAIEGECSLIVTGDKDLLRLGKFRSVKILTPAEFLERI